MSKQTNCSPEQVSFIEHFVDKFLTNDENSSKSVKKLLRQEDFLKNVTTKSIGNVVDRMNVSIFGKRESKKADQ